MQTHSNYIDQGQDFSVDCSPHWLTQMLHDLSKVGMTLPPKGLWSSPDQETSELLLRFSKALCSHEDTPPSVLAWLSSFDNPLIHERIAEHANTPTVVLHKLAASPHTDVRAAVADNPAVPFELLFSLCRDEHPDVRHHLAENSLLPKEILSILAEDENPYVAQRAQQSARRSSATITQPDTAALSVLIVDDDDVTRLILALSLKADPLINLLGTANSGETGIRLTIEQQPDIVLMDIGMPGMNGIAATAEIKMMVPSTKVIMVTSHDSLEEIVSAFGHGAEGYHLKSTPNHDLGKAIRVVAAGSYWLDPGIASLALRELSNKSISILKKISQPGLEYREPELTCPVKALLSSAEEYYANDRLSEARKICQGALSLSQTLYGDESTSTNEAMSRLADLYFLEGEYGSCESTYLTLVTLQSKLHELDDPGLEKCLSLLAEFYDFRWNHELSELFYAWLLRIREKTGDKDKISETRARLYETIRKQDKPISAARVENSTCTTKHS